MIYLGTKFHMRCCHFSSQFLPFTITKI